MQVAESRRAAMHAARYLQHAAVVEPAWPGDRNSANICQAKDVQNSVTSLLHGLQFRSFLPSVKGGYPAAETSTECSAIFVLDGFLVRPGDNGGVVRPRTVRKL